MNSTTNRCAFVRAEYVRILTLLLQCASGYRLSELVSEEEPTASHVVNDVTVDDSMHVASDVVEHLNSNEHRRSLDEAVDSEMRLLLESRGVDRQRDTEVWFDYFTLMSAGHKNVNIIMHTCIICTPNVDRKIKEQLLQQEAYPAIWPPVDTQNLAIPGAIPPKWENQNVCKC